MTNQTLDLVIQLAIMLAIGAAMAVVFVTISHFLMPSSSNPNKAQAYECGVTQMCDTRAPLNVHYYLVAVLFVLFDLEAVFLYPWAVSLRKLGTSALIEMFVFIAILLVGYVYAWRKGVFEWE